MFAGIGNFPVRGLANNNEQQREIKSDNDDMDSKHEAGEDEQQPDEETKSRKRRRSAESKQQQEQPNAGGRKKKRIEEDDVANQEEINLLHQNEVDLNGGVPFGPENASLERKSDTIDWERVNEEDKEAGEKFAQEKGWDDSKFVDPEWCVACHLTVTTNKFGINENDPYRNLCVYTERNYSKVSRIVLVSTIQKMYLDQIAECTTQNETIRFWFRKQIFDHIHTHARTIRVANEMYLSMNDAIMEKLYANIQTVDPITGQSNINLKMTETILKLQVQNERLLKNLSPHRSEVMF